MTEGKPRLPQTPLWVESRSWLFDRDLISALDLGEVPHDEELDSLCDAALRQIDQALGELPYKTS